MKAAPFSYIRPETLDGATAALAQHDGDAQVIAGGQTLLATLAFRLSAPGILIDISRLAELKGVTRQGNGIRIGAGTTHAELGRDPLVRQHAKLLTAAVPHIAHAAVRNRGTIGGSLAYADPAAELPACCLALGARLLLRGATSNRSVAAVEFFTGLFETALRPGELIVGVEIPLASDGDRVGLYEIARRAGDYAMAGAAVWLNESGGVVRQARLALFGVGPTAVLATAAAKALQGHALTPERINSACAALVDDIAPTADQNGSAATKRHLATVALRRALLPLM